MTIVHEGKIRHLASLKYAGAQVTTDVVQVLGVTQADAERLKERHGVAYKPLVDPAEMITLPSTPGQGARQVAHDLGDHRARLGAPQVEPGDQLSIPAHAPPAARDPPDALRRTITWRAKRASSST